MFNLMQVVEQEMADQKFMLRNKNTHRARYLHHDAETEQDVIVVIYFDLSMGSDFSMENLQDSMVFSDLMDIYKAEAAVTMRCEVRQL